MQQNPYFLITNNAEKLRIRLEELFNANTVYIQRIKDRPLEVRKDVDERDLEKIDQCVILFGDVKLMIADDTEGLPITKGNNVSLCVTYALFLIIIYIIDDYQKLWHKITGFCCKVKNHVIFILKKEK